MKITKRIIFVLVGFLAIQPLVLAQFYQYSNYNDPMWVRNFRNEVAIILASYPYLNFGQPSYQLYHPTVPFTIPPNPIFLSRLAGKKAFDFGAAVTYAALKDVDRLNKSIQGRVRITLVNEGGTNRVWCQNNIWVERFDNENEAFGWVAWQQGWTGYIVENKWQPSYSEFN